MERGIKTIERTIVISLILLSSVIIVFGASTVAADPGQSLPGNPTDLTAAPGDGRVDLSWSTPDNDGGAAIDYFVIYQNDIDVKHVIGNSGTIIGLTNGQKYYFTVAAHNYVGMSALSNSVYAWPYTVPDAPTGLADALGNGQITLNWTAPVFNGGRTIDYYIVYQDGVALPYNLSGPSTIIVGLTNGQTYTFTVSAHNLAGIGSRSNTVTATPSIPPSVPGIPTDLTAIPGNAQVYLSWTAPTSNGGAPIDYVLVYVDGVARSDHYLTNYATITGLTNGQSYEFTVADHNSVGIGPQSTAVDAIPMSISVPGAPTGLTAVAGYERVSLSWSAPVDNGGATIDYYVVVSDGADVAHPTNLYVVLRGLTNGHMYSYAVAAHNSAGVGASSAPTTAMPPVPSNLTVTSPASNAFVHTNSVTVNWTVVTGTYGIAKTEYSQDNSTWTTVNGTSLIWGGLANGQHILRIRTNDTAGNLVESSVMFTVDATVPTITSNTPTGGLESTRSRVNVTFSEAMNHSATTISIYGIAGTTTWDGNTATFTPSTILIGNTVFNVTVNGMDNGGNLLVQHTWSFSTANVGSISGVIRDQDGTPMQSADVELIYKSISGQTILEYVTVSVTSTVGRTLSTTTDAGGYYAFFDISFGKYTLTVTKSGFNSDQTNVIIDANAVSTGVVAINPVITKLSNSIGTTPTGSGLSDIPLVPIIILVIVVIAVVVVFKVLKWRKAKQADKLKVKIRRDPINMLLGIGKERRVFDPKAVSYSINVRPFTDRTSRNDLVLGDVESRYNATESIGDDAEKGIFNRDSLLRQIARLENKDITLVRYATWAISESAGNGMVDESALKPLIWLIMDGDIGICMNASSALGRMAENDVFDRSSLEPLIKLLNDSEPKVRKNAALVLGRLAEKKVLNRASLAPLVVLLGDDDLGVRKNSLYAIGRLSENEVFDSTPLPLFVGLLGDADVGVRRNAAYVIGQMAEKGFCDRSSLALLNALLGDSEDSVRKNAANAIGQMAMNDVCESSSLIPLNGILSDMDVGVRKNAAYAIGKMAEKTVCDKSSLPQLNELLENGDVDVRRNAAYAIGKMAEKGVVHNGSPVPLIRRLADDVSIRSEAALAIGQLAKRGVFDKTYPGPLNGLLRDSNVQVRQNVAFAIGQLAENGSCDRAALAPLIALLEDSDINVCKNAAIALGQLAEREVIDKSSLPVFTRLLNDNEPVVRSYATIGIRQLAKYGVSDSSPLAPLNCLLKDGV